MTKFEFTGTIYKPSEEQVDFRGQFIVTNPRTGALEGKMVSQGSPRDIIGIIKPWSGKPSDNLFEDYLILFPVPEGRAVESY